MEKVSSVERQLFILSLLSEHKQGYTIEELLARLDKMEIEATRRMVTRDIDYISKNFFVYEEKREGKIYYIADKYPLERIDFSISQVISLYFAKEVLKSYEFSQITQDALHIVDEILSKISGISKTVLSNIEELIKVVPARVREDVTDAAILEMVRSAAQNRRRLNVLYRSFLKGEEIWRAFDPYVLEIREGCWHVIGYCHLRNAVRDFRVSRIVEAVEIDGTFEVPEDFYAQYQKTRFDKLAGEELFDIEIHFYGGAVKLVQEFHSEKADRLEEKEGRLTFYKRAAITPDLIAWVLGFGGGAQVTQPKMLADIIQDEAEQLLLRYGGMDG
ncbi:MAG: helix-turn-helix transcriptional regulator [Christensenellaceae bacterium]|jgi:predicted DNA-binding transcriptional regulator YafY